MAEIITGVGVVWGLGSSLGATNSVTGTGIGTSLKQGADFDVESDVVEVSGYDGETVATAFFNDRDLLKLEVIPTGATIAAARSAGTLPRPGTVVTVVDTVDTQIAGATTTAYQFIRGTKRKTNKGAMVLNFELRRFKANDVTATVAAS